MPKVAAILLFGFLLLAIPCGRNAANPMTRQDCQPSLSDFSGILLDITIDNNTCDCGETCFQRSSTGSCELITGTLLSNCFVLQETGTASGNFTCSVPTGSVFDTVSAIIFSASAAAAAAPFVITVCLMVPYLYVHKKHHGHGKAARTTLTVIAASFAVGWSASVGLIIVGLIVEGSIENLNCVKAAG